MKEWYEAVKDDYDYINKMQVASSLVEKVQRIIISDKSMLDKDLETVWDKFKEDENIDVKKINEFIKEGKTYYLQNFFSSVMNTEKIVEFIKHVGVHLNEKERKHQFLNLVSRSICNLELVPFPTKNKGNVGDFILNEAYGKFGAAIVLARIAQYLALKKEGIETEKPIFIFRSKTDWFKVLETFINKEMSIKFNKNDINPLSDLCDLFYRFNSQSANISQNNISRVLTKDEFEQAIASVF